MPPAPTSRRALRLSAAAVVAAPLAFAAFGAGTGCGPAVTEIWVCLNPITGKLDDAPYDEGHYVGEKHDPCHCYDPCGPAKSCPIVVDAGLPPPGCGAGGGEP